jgi:hypothetical protein
MKTYRMLAYLVGTIGGLIFAGHASAQNTVLQTFKPDTWLCISPQVYEEAMVRIKGEEGKDIPALRKDLGDKKQCMLVEADLIEDMMAPFVLIIDRNSTKIQVQFIISARQRKEFLHRLIHRTIVTGWTEESNLIPRPVY